MRAVISRGTVVLALLARSLVARARGRPGRRPTDVRRVGQPGAWCTCARQYHGARSCWHSLRGTLVAARAWGSPTWWDRPPPVLLRQTTCDVARLQSTIGGGPTSDPLVLRTGSRLLPDSLSLMRRQLIDRPTYYTPGPPTHRNCTKVESPKSHEIWALAGSI